jgi:hypothetical protein
VPDVRADLTPETHGAGPVGGDGLGNAAPRPPPRGLACALMKLLGPALAVDPTTTLYWGPQYDPTDGGPGLCKRLVVYQSAKQNDSGDKGIINSYGRLVAAH